MTANEIIKRLRLTQLQFEDGYFRETWRSSVSIAANALPPVYGSARSAGTAIYYLLTPETSSRMHVVTSDEIFHFYLGDPVEQLLIFEDGRHEFRTIGNNLEAGQVPQALVPANVWQGAKLAAGGRFALMGTTVSPGFEFADFTLGDPEELAAHYPACGDWIKRL
jgi:predicted cupin superfamily sugar epimerase